MKYDETLFSQKRIVFKKAIEAGLKIEKNTSISELGELVSEVKPSELKRMSPGAIVTGMKELNKKRNMLDRRQTKAITEQVNMCIIKV